MKILSQLQYGRQSRVNMKSGRCGKPGVPSPVFDSFTFNQNRAGDIAESSTFSGSIEVNVLRSNRHSVSISCRFSSFTRWVKLAMRLPNEEILFSWTINGSVTSNCMDAWLLNGYRLDTCNAASMKKSRHLNLNWWTASGGSQWDQERVMSTPTPKYILFNSVKFLGFRGLISCSGVFLMCSSFRKHCRIVVNDLETDLWSVCIWVVSDCICLFRTLNTGRMKSRNLRYNLVVGSFIFLKICSHATSLPLSTASVK